METENQLSTPDLWIEREEVGLIRMMRMVRIVDSFSIWKSICATMAVVIDSNMCGS